MTRPTAILYALSAAIALISGHDVSAKPARPAFTFNDIEYDRTGAEAARAGKRLIANAVTTGMPAAQAVDTLRQAGARCKIGADRILCTHNSTEAVEEASHDVAWTIDLAVANGIVTRTAVQRLSIGS